MLFSVNSAPANHNLMDFYGTSMILTQALAEHARANSLNKWKIAIQKDTFKELSVYLEILIQG